MLQSKYLTEDGVKSFLQDLYNKGYRYIFFDPTISVYIASEQEPYFEDNKYMHCYGNKRTAIVSSLEVTVIQEWLESYLYIKIDKYIDVVDWGNVSVDTPVLAKDNDEDNWHKRYFAKYENGGLFAFAYGQTEWSSNGIKPIRYDKMKLVK